MDTVSQVFGNCAKAWTTTKLRQDFKTTEATWSRTRLFMFAFDIALNGLRQNLDQSTNRCIGESPHLLAS